jgi:predicted RNA-binding protein with TRAM domain
MEISDDLLCLFSAEVEERGDSYVVEVPKREITTGTLRSGEVYRTAMVTAPSESEPEEAEQAEKGETSNANQERDASGPPVEEGDIREVDIEDIGEQGDGITRVERGFVIIVPETEKGERVTIEITDVKQNVAFGAVKERQTHF